MKKNHSQKYKFPNINFVKKYTYKKFFKYLFIPSINLINLISINAETYKVTNFNRIEPGKLNISVYIFHDRNRNGIYDIGDLSMAGVETDMIKPDGMIVSEKSNKDGYTNFKMALGSSFYRDIDKDGELYIFNVKEPPKWEITTKNKKQKIIFLRKIGSPGGLIAANPPNWVGLAPNLTIKGNLSEIKNKSVQDFTIEAIDPNGRKKNIKVGENGNFLLNANKGVWKLIIKNKSLNREKIKVVNIKHAPVKLINIFTTGKEFPPHDKTVVENFDWIKYSSLEKIPNGHLGLKWDYLLAMNNKKISGPGYINVLNSGHGIGYSSSGHPVIIKAFQGKTFDFVGGYFSVGWGKANGEKLKIEAFRNGKLILKDEMKLSHFGPKWLEADIRRIDKLILSTDHYWQFAAEDLHFRIPN